jgi:Redoxin
LPDIEERFWNKYKDQGLEVVALNAHDQLEQIGEVEEFCGALGVSFPVGLEETKTYQALTQNFLGTNPFPVDVIVGKDGKIAYVTREYDPLAIAEVIEELLAQ